MTQLKVLIVDDTWMIRSALKDYLSNRGIDVLDADSKEGALDVLKDAPKLDVAVLDIVVPHRSGETPDFDSHVGIEIARHLRSLYPNLGIVFLSAYADRAKEVIDLFRDGHDRIVYLLKPSKPRHLLDAIRKVTFGLPAFELTPGVRVRKNSAFELAIQTLGAEETLILHALECVDNLTDKEREVFFELGNCYTQRQVASNLGYKYKAIQYYVGNIYDKLGFREGNSEYNLSSLLVKTCMIYQLHTRLT